jgi:hypothetical protein
MALSAYALREAVTMAGLRLVVPQDVIAHLKCAALMRCGQSALHA